MKSVVSLVESRLMKFFSIKNLVYYSKDCEAELRPLVKTYEQSGALSKHATTDVAIKDFIKTSVNNFQPLTKMIEKDIASSRSHCGGGFFSGSSAHFYFQWQLKPRSTSVDMVKINPAVASFFPGNDNFGESTVVSSHDNGTPEELRLGSGDQVFVLNSNPYPFQSASGAGLGYVFRTGKHALDGILFHSNIQTSTGRDVIVRVGLGHRHFFPGNSLSFPDRINSPAGIGLWSLADMLYDYNRLGHQGMVDAFGLEIAETVGHVYAAMESTYGLTTLLGEIGMVGWETRGHAYLLKKFVSVGGGMSRALQPVAKTTYYSSPYIYAFGTGLLSYLIWNSMHGHDEATESSSSKA
ncbi:hypothetical protein [Melittangium boletus]|uniref:hypothetical protein n=1 Tax=Melittangium boletus TaxID=83453 RepID=UPI003DA2BA30